MYNIGKNVTRINGERLGESLSTPRFGTKPIDIRHYSIGPN